MSVLTPSQVAGVLYRAGFRGSAWISGVSVVLAESGGNPRAVNVNSDSHRSKDRGLWQINDYWHPEVSDAQAFNPASASAAAFRISRSGTTFDQWATWPVSAGVQRSRASAGVHQWAKANGVKVGGLSGAGSAGAAGSGTGGGSAGGSGLGPADVAGMSGDVAAAVLGAAAASSPVEVARQAVFLAASAGAWMANPHNWLRVAMVVGGGFAVLAGVGMLAKSGAAGQTAQGAANTVTGAAKLGAEAAGTIATGGAGAVAKGAAVASSTAKAAGHGTVKTVGQTAKLVAGK